MAMEPEVKDAVSEWSASFIVGCIPLAAHTIYALLGEPGSSKSTWSIEILFIAITISGLSVVTTFIRIIKGTGSLSGRRGAYVLMALTVLVLLAAAIVYGIAVSSPDERPKFIYAGLALLVFSATISMYFELALARPLRKSRRGR